MPRTSASSGIPDGILLSRRLDPYEWEVMEDPHRMGGEILDGHHSKLLQMAARIARAAPRALGRRRVSAGPAGKGDPSGGADRRRGRRLRRPDLPKNPTRRPGRSRPASRRSAASRADHFDPAVVKAFFAALPRILDVKTRYAEPDRDPDSEPDPELPCLTRQPSPTSSSRPRSGVSRSGCSTSSCPSASPALWWQRA